MGFNRRGCVRSLYIPVYPKAWQHCRHPYIRIQYLDLVIPSLAPRPPRPVFVACSTKKGRRKDLPCDACRCWHHVQSAHTWVYSLPFTLLSLNSVRSSVQFVLRVWLLLDWSWLATVHDISSGTHHVINPFRPSPAFHTASDKSWAWRPGNEARLYHCFTLP